MEKARVLIVEDEAIVALEIKNNLQKLGYGVTSIIETGDDAISKAEKDKPDLILMDIDTKGTMNGIEAAEVIRNRFGIPVVFSADKLDEERTEQAKITMPFGYVFKPIQERDLSVSLETALYVARVNAEKSKAEQALKANEEKYRILLDESPDPIFSITADGEFVYANRTLAKVINLSEEEIIGKKIWDIFSEEEANHRFSALSEVFQTGKEKVIEVPNQHPDGDQYFLMTITPIIDANNNVINVVCTSKNITERKLAEEALKNSESTYRNMFMNSLVGLFRTDLATGEVIDANDAIARIAGYNNRKELLADKSFKITEHYITPGTREAIIEKLSKNGEFSNIEAQFRDKNGRILWQRMAGKLVPEKGWIEGITEEITYEKEVEQTLKKSEEKYRRILENMEEGYVELDLEGNVVFFNDALHKMIGYTREELQGISYKEITRENSNEWFKFYNTIYKTGKSDKLFDQNITKKNGDVIYLESSGSLKTDDAGEPVGFRSIIRDVTEKKRAERELKESEKKFRKMANMLPSIIFQTDKNGDFEFVNKAGFDAFGYKPGDFTQGPYSITQMFAEEDLARVTNDVSDVFNKKGRELGWREYSALKKNRERFPVSILSDHVENEMGHVTGMRGVIIDITEQKKAEKALRESEAKYRNVVENASIAICVIQDGYFKYFNPETIELFGYPAEELGQLPSDETIHPEDKDMVISIRLRRERGEQTIGYSHRIVTKDHRILWIDVKTVSIMWENQPAVLVFFRDITEQKRSGELMIQTEKMMSLGGLAAGVAHELNNPLGGMLQGVQNVQRRLSPELKNNRPIAEELGIDLQKLQSYLEQRKILFMLNGIQESGKKATQIITNMLQFSRKSESNMALVDLPELMAITLELANKDYDLKKRYDFRSIKIVKDFDSNLPPVPCTEIEIQQVILNLLRNATWAMCNQKQNVSPQIILRLLKEDDSARIEVEDNGPGMDETTRRKIFEPFFTTKPVGEGTGLGLSVSYMIITNNHKGTMEVLSKNGKGTKFIIKLPF